MTEVIDRWLYWPALAFLLAALLTTVGQFFFLDQLRVAVGDGGLFALHLIPFPFAWWALWPRDDGERIASGAGVGLHRSNFRRVLASCYAPYITPYRSAKYKRTRGNWWKTPFGILALGIVVLAVIHIWVLPAFCLITSAMLLRRSVYAGNVAALSFERWFVRPHYPTRACMVRVILR